ncbi:MAG: RnfABCDGE type electron transport complex subunit A [Paludibacteraceae bacterium]|nr:RnfABCDGE type electron transport complex subunit A [Paludibacteraceae bacterium]
MVYFLIFVSAILVNNIVLSQFLGICPFLGVSKKIDTALGMSAAVAFVLTVATIVTFLLQKLLIAWHVEFLQTILFILVIAALVQMIEIMLKKVSPSLYQALGVFLPLITTNCCILGVALIVADPAQLLVKLPLENGEPMAYNLLNGVLYALATAIGFGLALVLFAGIREQLALAKVPKAMQGTPIALLTAGLLAMAFMGFSGVA